MIAILSGAATLAFGYTILCPILKATNEEKLKHLDRLEKQVQVLKKENVYLAKNNKFLLAKLQVCESKSPFSGHNPIPNGFRFVKFGNNVDTIKIQFPIKHLSWMEKRIVVYDVHSDYFENFIVSFKIKNGKKIIDSISFYIYPSKLDELIELFKAEFEGENMVLENNKYTAHIDGYLIEFENSGLTISREK